MWNWNINIFTQFLDKATIKFYCGFIFNESFAPLRLCVKYIKRLEFFAGP